MYVICTAGHVDHGKSTLVKALTGMEPDRFAEEQRRGLTIDLGFAWAQLAGMTMAFVDLPGHERFVANMLAGAGAVDLALFVVAADEGWMPQSQEHLEILDLLGVSRGLVTLTKADTVDDDTLAIAEELVREQLAGTAFADVPVVATSAVSGRGLDTLVDALAALCAASPAPLDTGRPRLWVDRAFTIKGAGTVVTGTLAGGRLAVGDEVMVLPRQRGGRVRGLQSLKSSVETAAPGWRVAVNVSGLERVEVARGDAIVRPGQWRAADEVDAWVRALPGHEVGRKGAWHLHVGSGERHVRVAPLLHAPVDADGGFVRMVLDTPAALVAGDRFVLREAGRQATLGGGVVLDPDPPASPRGRAARAERVAALQLRHTGVSNGDHDGLLSLHVAERGAVDAESAAAAVGLTAVDAAAAAERAGLLPLGPGLAHPAAVDAWAASATAALATYHTAHPVDRAAPKDVAVRAVVDAGCPPAFADALLDALARRGRIVAEGPGMRTPEHAVRLDPAQTAARETLLASLRVEPFAPPNLTTAAAAAGASTALVRELEAAGEIVRVAPELGFSAAALEEAVAMLRKAFDEEGPLTAARAKEVLGTSRKYALPLLEELDRRGRTRRVGDTRVVLG